MNHCVLIAEVLTDPELRYTPDEQVPVTTLLVEFPGLRPEDPASRLRVVSWRNLAQEVAEKYHKGDRVVIEGRLGINSVEREGFKEKRAELTAQRIFALGPQVELTSHASAPEEAAAPSARRAAPPSYAAAPEAEPPPAPKASSSRRTKVAPPPPPVEPDLDDDIPF